MTFIMNVIILVVSLAITFRYGLREVFLPRYPCTPAAVLPFVTSSERLREDLKLVEA